MPKDWKSKFKEELFDWDMMPIYGLVYLMYSFIAMPFFTGENTWILVGITFLVTVLTFILATLGGILTEEKEEQEETEEEDDEQETEDFEEIFNDNAYDSREFMRVYKEETLQEETVFFSEIEGLLQDIEYIQQFGKVEENEEEEIYKNISSHVYNLLSSYVLLRKENRIQVINEFLPVLQEKRNTLYHTYIQTHQKDIIKDCQHHGEQLKEVKREYLYIQD